MLQRFACSDQTAIFLVIIVRFIGPVAIVDEGGWLIHERRDWRDDPVTAESIKAGIAGQALRVRRSIVRSLLAGAGLRVIAIECGLESRGIDDRFENRAGLPRSLCDAIELTGAVVTTADHRFDLAGMRIQCNQGRLRAR